MASATVLFCGKAINNTIKYLIVCFEKTCLKRQKIIWFKRKFALIQFLLTISTIALQALFLKRTSMNAYNYFDMVYYACVSMLTIGFGDISPNLDYYNQLDFPIMILVATLELILLLWSFSLVGSIIDFLTSFESDIASHHHHHHPKKGENSIVAPDRNVKCHVEINYNAVDEESNFT